MNRDPSDYSRLLVLLVLVPLLVADLAFGLPDGTFAGVGALVFVAAAGIHFYGGERQGAVGWLLFGCALGLVGLVDVQQDPLYLFAVGVLFVAGLFVLGSQRIADRLEE
ncbi:hypothetical protein [Natronomonas sp.]|uniref:hypothetical protein n=1 Tax=Natronomonas sp. TaxID=2184060 RepID=UPI002FC37276